MIQKIAFYAFITIVIVLVVSILYGIYTILKIINTPAWAIIIIECLCTMFFLCPIMGSGNDDIICH